MGKLDASLLRYLTGDDFRILTGVEMGMKNHELVPGKLAATISGLKSGGEAKTLHQLTRHNLLSYQRGRNFDGYRLTYPGYDYLALNVLTKRGSISQIGSQIGVGKESDVYVVANEKCDKFALKLHRLGRTCFRRVHDKRDYHRAGQKVHNWIYLSRLAAMREFRFMKLLHEKGLPVPCPIDYNRHAVVMELIDGTLLNHIHLDQILDVDTLFQKLIDLMLSLANDFGVVHGDFNEFNLMIKMDSMEPILIDFPQMVSTNHKLAKEYFNRDVECIVEFFRKRMNYETENIPSFDSDVTVDEKQSVLNSITDYCEDDIISNDVTQADDIEVTRQEMIEPHVELTETVAETDDTFNDNESVFSGCSTSASRFNPSVANSTFDPQAIRSKVRNEKQKVLKRTETKNATRKIKGDASAVRRTRTMNNDFIKQDLATHAIEPFC